MTTTTSPHPRRISLTVLLSFAASFFAAGAVALHFVGDTVHRTYLGFWGVDSGAFPKSADWLLVNGYYGLLERLVMLLGEAKRNWYWVLLITVLFGVYVFVLISPTKGIDDWKWFSRLSATWKRLVGCLAVSAWLTLVLFLTMLLAVIAMGAIGILGESSGRTTAERQNTEFAKGCSSTKYFCVDVISNGEVLFTGFILDSSVSHIAILDVASNRGRVLDRSGKEIAAHAKRPTAK